MSELTMKDQLLDTVDKLREEEVDFEKTPVLFKWSYQEEPHIEFQLLIRELDQASFDFTEVDTSVVH